MIWATGYLIRKVLQNFGDRGDADIEKYVRQFLNMDGINPDYTTELTKEYMHSYLA